MIIFNKYAKEVEMKCQILRSNLIGLISILWDPKRSDQLNNEKNLLLIINYSQYSLDLLLIIADILAIVQTLAQLLDDNTEKNNLLNNNNNLNINNNENKNNNNENNLKKEENNNNNNNNNENNNLNNKNNNEEKEKEEEEKNIYETEVDHPQRNWPAGAGTLNSLVFLITSESTGPFSPSFILFYFNIYFILFI